MCDMYNMYGNFANFKRSMTIDFDEVEETDEVEYRDKYMDCFNDNVDRFVSFRNIKECKQLIGSNGGLYKTLKYIADNLGEDNILLNSDEDDAELRWWRCNLYWCIDMNFKEDWCDLAYEYYINSLDEINETSETETN